jgi:hypothetical protein
LEAVHGAEVADLALGQAQVVEELARAVAVPDLDALRGERVRGGVARDEPEELGDDGFGEDALGGEEREDRGAVAVEGELEGARREDGVGACAGAGSRVRLVGEYNKWRKGVLPVLAEFALVEDFADQIKVLVFFVPGLRGGGGGRGRCRGGRILRYSHGEGV